LAGIEQHEVVGPALKAEASIFGRLHVGGDGYNITDERADPSDSVRLSFGDVGSPLGQLRHVKFLEAVHKYLRTYGRTAATEEVLGAEIAEF